MNTSQQEKCLFDLLARFPPSDLASSPEAPESLQLIGEKGFPPPGWVVFSLHFSYRAV